MANDQTKTKSVKKDKNLFFIGVVLMALSNIIVKVIGLVFKIPLHNLLGDEGMGYFNAAYRIYACLFMISTTGLPIAVSILVSESRAKGNLLLVKRIFRVTLSMFLILGIFSSCIMFFGAGVLTDIIKNDGALYCIVAIAPTLFFICITSALRGYFQGFQRMGPSAVSQVIESLGKLIIGILLAKYALGAGEDLPRVAAYAILGITVGVAAGTIYLAVTKTIYTGKGILTVPEGVEICNSDESSSSIIKRLVKIAVPITISASVVSLADIIDLGVITRRLVSIGYTESIANSMYGNYTTLAVPLFNLPPVLIYPISSSMIPYLSGLLASKNSIGAKNAMESSLKISTLISLPCAFGMSVLSFPILSLLFNDKSAGIADGLLSILAIAIIFLGIISVTNAVLQASHHERLPIVSMAVGAAVKLVSSYILLGIPTVNIYGTPISTLLCYITAASLNIYFVAKKTGIRPSIKNTFVRPLIAGAVCAAVAYFSYVAYDLTIGGGLSTILAIGTAGIVYLMLVFLLKCITPVDVKMLPKGERIYSLLCKVKLMK